MMRAFAAEWTKLLRPGFLAGFGVVVVVLPVLFTAIVLVTLLESPANSEIPAAAFLEGATGPTLPMILTLGIMGIAALVLGALATASDYSQGTLRVMLVAHPVRWSYLAGKTLALCAFISALLLVAVALQVPLTAAILSGYGADLSDWWTTEALAKNLGTVGRAVVSVCSRLLWGVMLATLMRNAAAAIGVGLGYDLMVDPILPLLIHDAGAYLPGQVLGAWMNGGTQILSLAGAGAFVAVYAVVFTGIAMLVFARRDVAV